MFLVIHILFVVCLVGTAEIEKTNYQVEQQNSNIRRLINNIFGLNDTLIQLRAATHHFYEGECWKDTVVTGI